MDGDNILRFPVSKTAITPRTAEMTTLAEDISELLLGECGNLDLSELLILIEVASGKLYEMGALLVHDRDHERLAKNFAAIRALVAAAHQRLGEVRRSEPQ